MLKAGIEIEFVVLRKVPTDLANKQDALPHQRYSYQAIEEGSYANVKSLVLNFEDDAVEITEQLAEVGIIVEQFHKESSHG